MVTKEQVEECVKHWIKVHRLWNWRVIVNWDIQPDDLTSLAQVCPTKGRYTAVIYFCHNFLDLSVEEISSTICHELAHLHTAKLYTVVEEMMDNCSKDMQDCVCAYMHEELEHITDTLTVCMTDYFEVPPCLGGKDAKKETVHTDRD